MGSICWLLLVSLVVTVVQLFDSGRCIVLFTDFFFPFFFFFFFGDKECIANYNKNLRIFF